MAQIAADPTAPGGQRPNITSAANGVPVVNIQTPSAAGVSRNAYKQFDVGRPGAVLNNSVTAVQTRQGGWVSGNPWLAGGSARIILNEVNSADPSRLNGYIEVAGRRAQVVIANPAGITCDGCGFLNADRATLTTGRPLLEHGALTGYRVEGGLITVQGSGLDSRGADYTDLIARGVEVNAGIWAERLALTAGKNSVNAENTAATPLFEQGGGQDAPAFAIDVARLGGMYAGRITLVGSEAGLGVRNAGQIGASGGDIVVTVDGRLENRGSGQIYGDRIALAAATLVQRPEGADTPVVGARQRLDIGVGELFNADGAAMLSLGDLAVGGRLENGRAAGRADFVDNASATIEALGDLALSTNRLVNRDAHVSVSTYVYPEETFVEYQGGGSPTRYPEGTEGVYPYKNESWHLATPEGNYRTWHLYNYTRTVRETRIADAAPARIQAGGSVTLEADDAHNAQSHIVAGGALDARVGSLRNEAIEGERVTADSGTITNYRRKKRRGKDTTSVSVAAYAPPPIIQELSLAPVTYGGGLAPVLVGQNPEAFPLSALYQYNTSPVAGYLIETRPAFADYRSWLGSDYLLSRLGSDPAAMQKRLGDGFYEQRLLSEQVGQLTGRRFLEGYANDESQYRALMDNAVTQASLYGFQVGIALTPEQVAQLTSDIVWLVEQEVTLPDGSAQKVLAPKIYARVGEGDLASSGSLTAGGALSLTVEKALENRGLLAGGSVEAAADALRNLGGRISGDTARLSARKDFENIGGVVDTAQSLEIQAGRDIRIESATRSSENAQGRVTNISRLAELYITGSEGGNLAVTAGRDIRLDGARVGNEAKEGRSLIAAGRNLALGATAVESAQRIAWDAKNWREDRQSQEVGNDISAAGGLVLQAGHDFSMRGGTVVSEAGTIQLQAGGDARITEARSARFVDEAHYTKGKSGGGTKTTETTRDTLERNLSEGALLSGRRVLAEVGHDLLIRGGSIVSDAETRLEAGGDIRVEAADETLFERHDKQKTKRGVFSSGVGFTIGKQAQSLENWRAATTASASVVGSIEGDVGLASGSRYVQKGSQVLAPRGDIAIRSGAVEIAESRESSRFESEHRFKQSGLSVSLSSPVISAIQTSRNVLQTAEKSGDSRLQTLARATAALEGYNAYSLLREGQGETINGKENQVRTGKANPDGTPETREVTVAEQAGGAQISITYGVSKSRSRSWAESDTAAPSILQAGNDVTVEAAGSGVQSDLIVRGSEIAAGGNVALRADHELALLAAHNVSKQESENKSGSAAAGVALSIGGGISLGVTASVGAGRGEADGNDLAWSNTHVQAGKAVRLESGEDLRLQGAAVRGEQVVAMAGGDLVIESLQDTGHYEREQKDAGASVTAGYGFSASANYSKSEAKSDYASVVEQSGIEVGGGGFQVSVRGGTTLTGGLMASGKAAEEEGRNRLETGTLETGGLNNHAFAKAKSKGFSVSTSMFDGKYGAAKGVLSNLMGSGGDSVKVYGRTLSAVGEGEVVITDEAAQREKTGFGSEETVALLNRDTENAHRSATPQDAEALLEKVEAARVVEAALFEATVKFTDEAYRRMFLKEAKIYRVQRVEDKEGESDQYRIYELTDDEKGKLKADRNNKVHIANNGIFNDLEGAAKYAIQHNPENEGPQYIIYFEQSNNFVSEMMVAGYQKFMEGDLLGLTNATVATKDAMLKYGKSGLRLDGHSRGSMTVENALKSLMGEPESAGVLGNTTINYFGPAANAKDSDKALSYLQGRENKANPQEWELAYQNHASDFVGRVIGGNPATGGTFSSWETLRIIGGKYTAHSCYGSAPVGCKDVHNKIGNAPTKPASFGGK